MTPPTLEELVKELFKRILDIERRLAALENRKTYDSTIY